MTARLTTVRELLAEAVRQLADAGISTPRVDAELLLGALLGVERTRLVTAGPVPESVAVTYRQHVDRRASREPLQHITGIAPFRHVELAVGAGVFVPRPETELLVDAVLPHLRGLDSPLVVDLCAGSGALALAVADELPGARLVAVEGSPTAARWLARNADGTPVQVVIADVADADALREFHGRVAAVLANPPYVPDGTPVQPEVLADPPDSVFAGPDGLDLMPSVIACAALLLGADGVFAVEHDDSQAASVPALIEADGRWRGVIDHCDLGGRARFTTARRCVPPR